jgi:hypothetical protein
MSDWYEIGITVGIGVAAGIAFAGVLGGLRFGFATTLLGALLVGVVAGLLVKGWLGVGGGVAGAVIGSISAASIVRGANRRGATLGGTTFLLLGAAVVVGLLALIPLVGYLEALVLPVVAARRSRNAPEKFAGLRSLAK